MKSGEAVKDKEKIALEDTPDMLSNAINTISQRGKAKRGDKTILDALFPALEGLGKAVAEHKSFKEAFGSAYTGAKSGAESTKQMKSTFGKAAVYGDKSIGKQDPGATVAMYIFEAILSYLR